MEKIFAKKSDNLGYDICCAAHDDERRITQLREAGFLEVVTSECPECDAGFIAQDTLTIENGKFVQTWEIVVDPRIKQTRIDELKAQLDATDYKVVKCYECIMVGKELPYNVQELHDDRQAIRDEINKLEAELLEL